MWTSEGSEKSTTQISESHGHLGTSPFWLSEWSSIPSSSENMKSSLIGHLQL